MSPEDRRPFFRSGPKRPPPEHGIKIKSAGLTWWGQRWIEALERMAPGYGLRLARGKTYARAGRTHDLSVHAGLVTAKVTGSRPQPYDVELQVSQLKEAVWKAAIENMAAKAQFTAELLAGEMPRAIDEAFASAKASVFPVRTTDLVTKCSCPDWANPCKHVAATHYVLGEALDRDPFLLFELRGRTKDQVLAALRAARGGSDTAADSRGLEADTRMNAVRLERVDAEDYDAPRAPLPALQLEFEAPKAHAAVLQQLGKPAAWSGSDSPLDVLAPFVKAAADRARAMALAESEPESETESAHAAPEPAHAVPEPTQPKPTRKRTQPAARTPAKRTRKR
ncbi:MAG TPA: hypothetical protein VFG30_14320 [Polyangiales bacterium]|nr:hypothetical protein [Polyangiales bacterium]